MEIDISEEFKKIDQRFETLKDFLRKHTATKDDAARLRAELADKADIDRVHTAVDTVYK